MESVNYKSLEEANNLLNQDDLPSSNSRAPPSPSPSKRSRSKSPKKSESSREEEEEEEGEASSPLKSKDGNLNGNKKHDLYETPTTTGMECGPKKLVIVAGICSKYLNRNKAYGTFLLSDTAHRH